jgi:hypothetical protein
MWPAPASRVAAGVRGGRWSLFLILQPVSARPVKPGSETSATISFSAHNHDHHVVGLGHAARQRLAVAGLR